MLKSSSLAGAATLALTGCLYIDGGGDHPGSRPGPGAFADLRTSWHTVYGVQVRGDALFVRAPSNGCTDKDDFDVRTQAYTDVHDRTVHRVSLRREDRDDCKAIVPEGEELRFGFDELGIPRGAIVVLANPLQD